MRKVEPLPTQDCEAGYAPDPKRLHLTPRWNIATSSKAPFLPKYAGHINIAKSFGFH